MKCAYCSINLLHDLARFHVETAEGRWPICASCIRSMLDGLDLAHARAGDMLEELWGLG